MQEIPEEHPVTMCPSPNSKPATIQPTVPSKPIFLPCSLPFLARLLSIWYAGWLKYRCRLSVSGTVTVMVAVTWNLYGNDGYDDIDEAWDEWEEGR